MNILIVGSGGREHALAWAIKQNPKCDQLTVIPGNAGISEIANCITLNILDNVLILDFVHKNKIDLVIIGPEEPLANGLSDFLRSNGISVFGPSKAAAQLEISKNFTKEICQKVKAPTARFELFMCAEKAKNYVSKIGTPIVIKLDGLAAGKGVVVASSEQIAFDAIDNMFNQATGTTKISILIEEFLDGEEASFFILSDGKNLLPIGTAQDHKRAYDNDMGPNTGGMGAYSPAPILTQEVVKKAIETIIKPTIEEMERRGTPYEGVIFAGLMIDKGIPKLIEYNVRFGDPECQALMIRLGAQILDLILACNDKKLAKTQVNWADDHSITVVMATQGYPQNYVNGSEIRFISEIKNDSLNQVFHAGTKITNSSLLANGGRVLNITTRAQTLEEARNRAYENIKTVDWPEGFYRTDIGWRAL
tara:strand:- start:62 stop:1324 length:1263 start_codon:yes stop_codon:yes gene_type:complete